MKPVFVGWLGYDLNTLFKLWQVLDYAQPVGVLIEGGATIGASTIPVGPGNTQRQLDLMKQLKTDRCSVSDNV